MLTFKGAARKRSPDAIMRAAASISVETAVMGSIIKVESSGSGFDAKGRPKALFEPHRFYKELAKYPAKLKAAVAAGLAYPIWGEKPYPKDSYARIAAAAAIDETAAIRATSWGLPQILGSNCVESGFSTPQAMLAAFCDGEDRHIMAMASFIAASKALLAAARSKNWDALAAGYNGKKYRIGGYQTKLAAAYKTMAAADKTVPVRVSSVADLPPPEVAPAVLKVTSPSTPTVSGDVVFRVQRQLRDLGYYEVGTADSDLGSRAQSAITAFRIEKTLPIADADQKPLGIDDQFLAALAVAGPRPVSEARANATAASLRAGPQGSIILKQSYRARMVAWFSGVAGSVWATVSGALPHIPEIKDKTAWVTDLFGSIPPWVYGIGVVGAAIFVYGTVKTIDRTRVDMHRKGEAA